MIESVVAARLESNGFQFFGVTYFVEMSADCAATARLKPGFTFADHKKTAMSK